MNTSEALPVSTPMRAGPRPLIEDDTYDYTVLLLTAVPVFLIAMIPLMIVIYAGKCCLKYASRPQKEHKILNESVLEESIAAKSRLGMAIPNPYMMHANPYYPTLEHRFGDPHPHAPSLASYFQRTMTGAQCAHDTATIIEEEEKVDEINNEPEVLSTAPNPSQQQTSRKQSLEISDI